MVKINFLISGLIEAVFMDLGKVPEVRDELMSVTSDGSKTVMLDFIMLLGSGSKGNVLMGFF